MRRYFKPVGMLLVLVSLLAVGLSQVAAGEQRPFKMMELLNLDLSTL